MYIFYCWASCFDWNVRNLSAVIFGWQTRFSFLFHCKNSRCNYTAAVGISIDVSKWMTYYAYLFISSFHDINVISFVFAFYSYIIFLRGSLATIIYIYIFFCRCWCGCPLCYFLLCAVFNWVCVSVCAMFLILCRISRYVILKWACKIIIFSDDFCFNILVNQLLKAYEVFEWMKYVGWLNLKWRKKNQIVHQKKRRLFIFKCQQSDNSIMYTLSNQNWT